MDDLLLLDLHNQVEYVSLNDIHGCLNGTYSTHHQVTHSLICLTEFLSLRSFYNFINHKLHFMISERWFNSLLMVMHKEVFPKVDLLQSLWALSFEQVCDGLSADYLVSKLVLLLV